MRLPLAVTTALFGLASTVKEEATVAVPAGIAKREFVVPSLCESQCQPAFSVWNGNCSDTESTKCFQAVCTDDFSAHFEPCSECLTENGLSAPDVLSSCNSHQEVARDVTTMISTHSDGSVHTVYIVAMSTASPGTTTATSRASVIIIPPLSTTSPGLTSTISRASVIIVPPLSTTSPGTTKGDSTDTWTEPWTAPETETPWTAPNTAEATSTTFITPAATAEAVVQTAPSSSRTVTSLWAISSSRSITSSSVRPTSTVIYSSQQPSSTLTVTETAVPSAGQGNSASRTPVSALFLLVGTIAYIVLA